MTEEIKVKKEEEVEPDDDDQEGDKKEPDDDDDQEKEELDEYEKIRQSNIAEAKLLQGKFSILNYINEIEDKNYKVIDFIKENFDPNSKIIEYNRETTFIIEEFKTKKVVEVKDCPFCNKFVDRYISDNTKEVPCCVFDVKKGSDKKSYALYVNKHNIDKFKKLYKFLVRDHRKNIHKDFTHFEVDKNAPAFIGTIKGEINLYFNCAEDNYIEVREFFNKRNGLSHGQKYYLAGTLDNIKLYCYEDMPSMLENYYREINLSYKERVSKIEKEISDCKKEVDRKKLNREKICMFAKIQLEKNEVRKRVDKDEECIRLGDSTSIMKIRLNRFYFLNKHVTETFDHYLKMFIDSRVGFDKFKTSMMRCLAYDSQTKIYYKKIKYDKLAQEKNKYSRLLSNVATIDPDKELTHKYLYLEQMNPDGEISYPKISFRDAIQKIELFLSYRYTLYDYSPSRAEAEVGIKSGREFDMTDCLNFYEPSTYCKFKEEKETNVKKGEAKKEVEEVEIEKEEEEEEVEVEKEPDDDDQEEEVKKEEVVEIEKQLKEYNLAGTPLIKLIRHICGEGRDAKEKVNKKFIYICKYFKCCIIGKKAGVTPIVAGDEGSGKSLIFEMLLSRLMGKGKHIKLASVEQAIGRFNGIIAGRYVIVLDEFKPERGKWAQYCEKMKSFITQPTIEIEMKGKEIYTQDNDFNIIILKNKEDNFVTDAGSRRYFYVNVNPMFKNIHSPEHKKFFDPLKDDIVIKPNFELLSNFYTFVMKQSLDDFQYGVAPMTDEMKTNIMNKNASDPLTDLICKAAYEYKKNKTILDEFVKNEGDEAKNVRPSKKCKDSLFMPFTKESVIPRDIINYFDEKSQMKQMKIMKQTLQNIGLHNRKCNGYDGFDLDYEAIEKFVSRKFCTTLEKMFGKRKPTHKKKALPKRPSK